MEGGGKGGKGKNIHKLMDVFKNIKGRHAGLIKALTTDVQELFKLCDPEKENLCLYGLPNEQWAVDIPVEEVPPELPEPVLGINFARDGLPEKDWLSFVAYHSDAWLLAVAFYAAARFGFNKADRKKLFDMINDLPTIHEVVTGVAKTQQKEKTEVAKQSKKNKSKPNAKKRAVESRRKSKKLQEEEENEDDEKEEEDEVGLDIEKDDEEEQGETLCGACGEKYKEDEFWICCDKCETWFHGQCVKITPAQAEFIKQYKCPPCSSKRSRT